MSTNYNTRRALNLQPIKRKEKKQLEFRLEDSAGPSRRVTLFTTGMGRDGLVELHGLTEAGGGEGRGKKGDLPTGSSTFATLEDGLHLGKSKGHSGDTEKYERDDLSSTLEGHEDLGVVDGNNVLVEGDRETGDSTVEGRRERDGRDGLITRRTRDIGSELKVPRSFNLG